MIISTNQKEVISLRFKLNIDSNAEEITEVTAKKRSSFVDELEYLILKYNEDDKITAYTEDDIKILKFSEIDCVTVINGKTTAIDNNGQQFRLKHRLYELESILPASFIKINKSSIANRNRIEKFTAAFSGSIDAVFKSGYTDYVSRRCFAQIRKELKAK